MLDNCVRCPPGLAGLTKGFCDFGTESAQHERRTRYFSRRIFDSSQRSQSRWECQLQWQHNCFWMGKLFAWVMVVFVNCTVIRRKQPFRRLSVGCIADCARNHQHADCCVFSCHHCRRVTHGCVHISVGGIIFRLPNNCSMRAVGPCNFILLFIHRPQHHCPDLHTRARGDVTVFIYT